jgi:hypothetical protein
MKRMIIRWGFFLLVLSLVVMGWAFQTFGAQFTGKVPLTMVVSKEELCPAIKNVARKFMFLRQTGMSKEDLVKDYMSFNPTEGAKDMMDHISSRVFEYPIVEKEQDKIDIINRFSLIMEKSCYHSYEDQTKGTML